LSRERASAPRRTITSNVRSGVQGDQNKRDVVIGQYAGIVALYGVSVAGVEVVHDIPQPEGAPGSQHPPHTGEGDRLPRVGQMVQG